MPPECACRVHYFLVSRLVVLGSYLTASSILFLHNSKHCLVGDVFTTPRTVPTDALYRGVGLQLGFCNAGVQGGHAQHPTAAGNDLAMHIAVLV